VTPRFRLRERHDVVTFVEVAQTRNNQRLCENALDPIHHRLSFSTMVSPAENYVRVAIASCLVAVGYGFHASKPSFARASSALNVAVDPTTITKKEYQDICGVSFDGSNLLQRLKATNFLYPKHVEVIEDIAPIAGEMVDNIVSAE